MRFASRAHASSRYKYHPITRLGGGAKYGLVKFPGRKKYTPRAYIFVGARIRLRTILGQFSINYFSGLGLRIRVRFWVGLGLGLVW